MEYSEFQKQEFKREFASRRLKQILITGPVVVLMIFFSMASEGKITFLNSCTLSLLMPVFLFMVIGVLVFSLTNWRCPACNSYLGKLMNPRYCPKCGIGLR
ncbi:MAG: hypothetical protein HGB06_04760 [Chlorobaculum sp.]|jgi:hypothetical protein|nr:hypothetical protein [Chlorobaculum sp.]